MDDIDIKDFCWIDIQTIEEVLYDMEHEGVELYKKLGGSNKRYYEEALKRFIEKRNKMKGIK